MPRDMGGDGGVHRRRVGGVAGDGGIGGVVQVAPVQVIAGDKGAFGKKAFGNAAADAAGRAGDEHRLGPMAAGNRFGGHSALSFIRPISPATTRAQRTCRPSGKGCSTCGIARQASTAWGQRPAR